MMMVFIVIMTIMQFRKVVNAPGLARIGFIFKFSNFDIKNKTIFIIFCVNMPTPGKALGSPNIY